MRIVKEYWNRFEAQWHDLAISAWMLTSVAGAGLVTAKWLAVLHAYRGSGFGECIKATILVLPSDLLTVGILFLLTMLGRRLNVPRVLRVPAFIAMTLFYAGMLIVSFVNVEFFASLGSPITYHLVLLAPSTARYLFLSGINDKSGALITGAVFIAIILLAGPLIHPWVNAAIQKQARWQRRTWLAPFGCLAAGGALYLVPVYGFREYAIRRMNPIEMFLPEREPKSVAIAPPSPAETRVLQMQCAPHSDDGMIALADAPRKKYNIIVWVWESVGLRYLKSYHPEGAAATPNLDRLFKRGGIHFQQAYCECALTVQASWALMTGKSPPARPIIFNDLNSELPPHRPLLNMELKKAGYHTGIFNSSNISMWGTDRVFKIDSPDVLEDQNNLPNRSQFLTAGWGLEDDAVVDRCLDWIDKLPRNEPFFAMLWNIETHHPFVYAKMPENLKKAPDLLRYIATIEHSDAILGAFYDGIAKRKLDANTILVIVGDHGEGLGRPPRPFDCGHSMLVYEDDMQIPLFFLNPVITGAKAENVKTHCTSTDIYPTLLDIAGLPIPNGLDGASLMRTYPIRPQLMHSIVWWPIAIRAGDYKLVIEQAGAAPELYDIQHDPLEATNIAEREIDIANALSASLLRWSANRYQHDASFRYGFSYFLPASQPKNVDLRPDARELFNKK